MTCGRFTVDAAAQWPLQDPREQQRTAVARWSAYSNTLATSVPPHIAAPSI